MHRFLAPMLACAALIAPVAAVAQSAAPPPCDGRWATIRTSTVNPGKMPLFEKAVEDQDAWYAGKGAKSFSRLARMVTPPSQRPIQYLDTEVMTITVHPDVSSMGIPHDAAWDAFVAEFRESSAIKDEYRVCLPDLAGR